MQWKGGAKSKGGSMTFSFDRLRVTRFNARIAHISVPLGSRACPVVTVDIRFLASSIISEPLAVGCPSARSHMPATVRSRVARQARNGVLPGVPETLPVERRTHYPMGLQIPGSQTRVPAGDPIERHRAFLAVRLPLRHYLFPGRYACVLLMSCGRRSSEAES